MSEEPAGRRSYAAPRPLWSADVGHLGDRSMSPCGSVGVGSTAAVASGVLAVGGGDDAYYGLDPATGAMLWRHDLGVEPGGNDKGAHGLYEQAVVWLSGSVLNAWRPAG